MDFIDYTNSNILTLTDFRNSKKNIELIKCYINTVQRTILGSGKLIFLGNGGSAAEAQHISAEYVSRFRTNRPAIGSLALSTDTSNLTAIGNDYGFENVFSRQIEALAQPRDTVIALTTSGKSPNIIKGLEAARLAGAATVAIMGNYETEISKFSDIVIHVPSQITSIIQEISFCINHYVCGEIEEWFIEQK